MAPQRDEISKQKVKDCVQHIILKKSTNFHAIRSWSFRNICNEIEWQVAPFLRHPVVEIDKGVTFSLLSGISFVFLELILLRPLDQGLNC